jgi:hypothetical protein
MVTIQEILVQIYQNLNLLKEKEAKHGGYSPLDLYNEIRDHEQAILLIQQALVGDLSETDCQQELRSLLLPPSLLAALDRFIPDLPLHEQAYLDRLKARYAEEVAYYIPLAGETTEAAPTSAALSPHASVPPAAALTGPRLSITSGSRPRGRSSGSSSTPCAKA